MKKNRKPKQRPAAEPEETRAAEAATVAWMLAMMVGLLCEVGWVVASWWRRVDDTAQRVGMLADLLFFSSLIVGLASLAVLPVVLKSRRLLPPLGITVFAAIVGAAPLVVLLWHLVR